MHADKNGNNFVTQTASSLGRGTSPLSNYVPGENIVDDFTGSYVSIFSDVYDSLINKKLINMDKDEFLTQLGRSGVSPTDSGMKSNAEYALGYDYPDNFTKLVNEALFYDVLGLTKGQKVSIFKGNRYSQAGKLNPTAGGYYSIDKEMAMGYIGSYAHRSEMERILGRQSTRGYIPKPGDLKGMYPQEDGIYKGGFKTGNSGNTAREVEGLYQLDLLPEEFPQIAGIGGMIDEMTTLVGNDLISRSRKVMSLKKVLEKTKDNKVGRNFNLNNRSPYNFAEHLSRKEGWLKNKAYASSTDERYSPIPKEAIFDSSGTFRPDFGGAGLNGSNNPIEFFPPIQAAKKQTVNPYGEIPPVSSGLRKILEPKNTVYAATRGMKLPPVAKKTQAEIDKIELAKIAKENEGMRQEFSREWELAQIAKKEAAMASGTIDWAAISASLPKVAKKAGKKPAAEIEMKPKKNKTTKPSYYLYQGADDDISLYHNIFSAGAKSEEGTIKGVAAILHDPFDGSLLETIGNKGSITESFDLMALALMDAARMSGTTKTGLNAGIVSSRTDYSQKLVDTLKARGLDKIVDIHPRILPRFVDETGKKTPPGSKVGGQVWLENELRFLNNESKRYDVLKSSTPIPDSVVKIAKQTLLDLLKYGFDKKQIDDAVKQYGKGMNIPGYAMGGIVAKYMASGGMASGTDTVPAMLTPGEFVVNRKATQAFGPLLSAINSPTFSLPNRMSSSLKSTGSGSKTAVNNSKTLYNYSVNVNVSNSGANPNDIARTVINQIKQIDNQRLRSF